MITRFGGFSFALIVVFLITIGAPKLYHIILARVNSFFKYIFCVVFMHLARFMLTVANLLIIGFLLIMLRCSIFANSDIMLHRSMSSLMLRQWPRQWSEEF